MGVLRALLRYYSYLFHALLALLMIALATVTRMSGSPKLELGMLPWSGDTLLHVLLYGAIAGLVIVVLAMRGTLRVLFLLWSLTVAVILVRGYIFTSYRFAPNEFQTALYLTGAAILAIPGASQLRTEKRRR